MNGFRIRDSQKSGDCAPNFINEDIGIPPTYSSKKKKPGHADPRFKRLINAEFRRETEAEGEKFGSVGQQSLDNQVNEGKALDEKVSLYFKPPEESNFFTMDSLKKFESETEPQELSEEVTKDFGFRPLGALRNSRIENFKNLEKRKGDFPANLKRSLSDCTLNKKKPFMEELDDEVCDKIRAYPSATRLSKVQNWMREYNVFPEKRRSVITVIGQTQTRPFSKILNEINQRRKLAKELDKHALCEALMESANNQQVPGGKNVVAKVDLVLPDGKVIYSTEKVYLRKDNKIADAVYPQKSMEILDINVPDKKKKRTEMIPERDSSTSQTGRKIRGKRLCKKLALSPNPEMLEEKGDVKVLYRNATSGMLLSLLAFISVAMCMSAFFYPFKTYNTYSIVEFFKPKTTAWYEKLLF